MKINVNLYEYEINDAPFERICDGFRKRVIKILYLKEDLEYGKITEYDLDSYIDTLNSDLYGAYVLFNEVKFINCMCELEGIKKNIDKEFLRKKVLDLASFVKQISTSKRED